MRDGNRPVRLDGLLHRGLPFLPILPLQGRPCYSRAQWVVAAPRAHAASLSGTGFSVAAQMGSRTRSSTYPVCLSQER